MACGLHRCGLIWKGGRRMKTVLTIAGSDCSGGAGIQADLKTIGAFGLYGMSALTAITVQNACGVFRVEPVKASVVEEQLRAVFEDIPPDAVKVGMVVNRENIQAVAAVLRKYRPAVILDPVMISTSGTALLDERATEALTGQLFPLAELVTPNLPEAQALWGRSICSDGERELAARELAKKYGCSVLIKGGHGAGSADDLLYNSKSGVWSWFRNEKISNCNTHGTGCTLSSAAACGLAQGLSLEESVRAAKEYITGAIQSGMRLGHGNGPLNHFFQPQKKRGEKADGIK